MLRSIVVAACVVLAVGCTPPARPNVDGLGESTDRPTGTEYKLPEGVTVQGTIYGGQADPCMDVLPRGNGDYVEACIALNNASTSAVTLTLPGGLVFISESTAVQNGLLVQEQVITLPPQTVTAIYLRLFCLNGHRDPSWYEDVFTFGPITDHPGLEEIVDILRTRTIDTEVEEDVVQFAVWEVTDDAGRISAETRAELQGI